MVSERLLSNAGTLYLVPTPIGHLQDITLRALQTLRDAQFIAAEDTRHTRKLLTHFDIHPPLLFSCHQHNAREAVERIVAKLAQGMQGALVTDAGTPGVSDPGSEVIARLLADGLPFVVLPGPAAFVTALVGSGLDTNSFSFHGFLPRSDKERAKCLAKLSQRPETLVFYESPHRIGGTLTALAEALGERRFVIARELTKLHEEYLRGSLQEDAGRISQQGVRGEMVVLVEGFLAARALTGTLGPDARDAEPYNAAGDGSEQTASADEAFVALTSKEHVDVLVARGLSRNDAVREAAKARGLSRNELYRQLLGKS